MLARASAVPEREPAAQRACSPAEQNRGGMNHGKKSSKSNWDCTICPSCREAMIRPVVEKPARMAGVSMWSVENRVMNRPRGEGGAGQWAAEGARRVHRSERHDDGGGKARSLRVPEVGVGPAFGRHESKAGVQTDGQPAGPWSSGSTPTRRSYKTWGQHRFGSVRRTSVAQ